MMKFIPSILAVLFLPLLGMSQVDTVDKGKVTYIDSIQQMKIELPFNKRMVNGTTKGFDLESNNLLMEGNNIDNKREGVWNYYEYDSLGEKSVYQFFTFKSDTLNGSFKQRIDSLVVSGNYTNGVLEGAFKEEIITYDDSHTIIMIPVDSGQYTKGMKYGLWTYLKNGNLAMVGNYEKDQRHLHWKIYDTINPLPQTLMRDIQYFEGNKTGVETVYFRYEDGKKVNEKESIPWQMGELSGNYTKKNARGIVLESGMYSDNIKIGKWVYNKPEDNTKETYTYLNNHLNGPYIFEKGSVVTIKGTYALDKKNKTWSYYSENGILLKEESYDKDLKTGEWNFYNKSKMRTRSLVFEKDTVVELHG